LKPGDTLRIDDDKLRFRVLRKERRSALARAERAGTLQPRKGINVVEHPVTLEDLSERDRRAVALAARFAGVRCAISFVADGTEARWVHARLPERPVIGKVERAEAVGAIHRLAVNFDELWICRGDLGAQLGSPSMARFVGRLDPVALGKPVLMAGQTLEHLTSHPEPTRSEVCHLFDLIARGYSGIVLSDETAIGRDPAGAVRTAAGLLRAFDSGG
jgi:pyruvate kinase